MSNDDDNSPTGESSPGDRSFASDTLLSSEFAAPIPDVLEASTKPDFEAPTTQLTAQSDLADDVVRETVDRVWDEMFEVEETSPSQVLSFPEDRDAAFARATEPPADHGESPEPEPAPQPEPVPLDELDDTPDTNPAMVLPTPDHSFEGSLDDIDIDDALPEPIREDVVATLHDLPTDEVPAAAVTPYPGDNTPITAFADAHTQVLDSPFDLDPIVAKLVAVDGPAEGQEFFASALRSTVGRGTTNAIVVPDLAMSREHFEVVRNPDDTFSLIDLDSINGTALNGALVREADLLHGDRVEAGKTRFQFILTPHPPATTRERHIVRANPTLTGARIPAAPQSPAGMSTYRLIVSLGLGAVVISIALFAIVATLQIERATPPEQPPTEDATAFYLRGVDAVKDRDWDTAHAEFSAARTLDPSLDGVDLQLQRIQNERDAEAAIQKSRQHHEAGRDTEALEALEAVPKDSVYIADADELRRSIRTRQVSILYTQAQEALSSGHVARARELAEDIVDRVPSHRGALQILEEHQAEDME